MESTYFSENKKIKKFSDSINKKVNIGNITTQLFKEVLLQRFRALLIFVSLNNLINSGEITAIAEDATIEINGISKAPLAKIANDPVDKKGTTIREEIFLPKLPIY